MDVEEKKKNELEIIIKYSTTHIVKVAKGSWELIKTLLIIADVSEQIHVTPYKKITGSPHTKGVKIRGSKNTSIEITVQPGNNNTRRIYWIQIPRGREAQGFLDELKKAAEIMSAKPEKAPQQETRDEEEKMENVSINTATQETDSEGLRGFSNDPEKVAIILMEIREVQQTAEREVGKLDFIEKRVCADAVLKFMPKGTGRKTAGPIIAKLRRNGYLLPIKEKFFPDRTTGYELAPLAMKLIEQHSMSKTEERAVQPEEKAAFEEKKGIDEQKLVEKIAAVVIRTLKEGSLSARKEILSALKELQEKEFDIFEELTELRKEFSDANAKIGASYGILATLKHLSDMERQKEMIRKAAEEECAEIERQEEILKQRIFFNLLTFE